MPPGCLLIYSQALLQCLGAAAVLAAPTVPSWTEGYGLEGNVGGLLEAMLSPVGNFGKFLTVLLSLSVTGNIACTLYSICFNFQVMIPAMTKVPRYVFSIVGTVMSVFPFVLSFLSPANLKNFHRTPIAHCHYRSWAPTNSMRR